VARGLTQVSISKHKPDPTKRIELPDRAKPGLHLVIQPSGRKSWAVRYRFGGKSRKLTLTGFPTLAIARQLAQDALNKIAQGIDPAEQKKQERNRATNSVDDVFADFMARHVRKRGGKPIRESTRRETGRLLGLEPKFDDLTEWRPRDPVSGVLAEWKGRDITQITKRDVLSLIEGIAESGAPIGANRTLSALKTVFRWCVQRDITEASPTEYIDHVSPETPKGRRLTDAEIGTIYRAAGSQGMFGLFVRFLLLCGQRRGETLRARWEDIDLQRKVWMIPGSVTKNGRDHLVPLSDPALAILRSILSTRQRKSGFIFAESSAVPIANMARRKFHLDQAAGGLAHWRLHDCRHTLKTFMQEQRVPEDVRNAVQNHSDGDMDSRYGHHTFEAEKRDVLSRWAKHVTRVS